MDFVPLGDRSGHLCARLCCSFSGEIVGSREIVGSGEMVAIVAAARLRVAVDYTRTGGF